MLNLFAPRDARLTLRTAHAARVVRALLVASIVTSAACGGGSTSPGTTPAKAEVDAVPSLAFTPPTITVAVGETVTFTFGSVAHNVFFDPQTGAPSDIAGTNAGVSVERVFTALGTYRYTCHIHPSMSGTVVVQASAAGARVSNY